jgi:4-diphosphocytidyl-2-C-methyl-D-erythritol kinase
MARASLRVLAYAKLNLTLRVVSRRADGYHLLQSLMVAVDLADEVELSLGGAGVQLCAPTVVPPEENLVVRAAGLLRAAWERVGVRISLCKRIPVGAGLGGGSSDAAATLVGLSELLGLGLPEASLCRLGESLGADVPFFLGPSPAWAEGVGEHLTPVELELPGAFLLLIPPFACPTGKVYRAFDALGLPFSPPTTPPSARGIGPSDFIPRAKGPLDFQNDLWPAAQAVRPALGRLRGLLAGIPSLGVGMTGSGSGLFAAFSDRVEAARAAAELPREKGVRLLVVGPVGRGYNIQK